MPVERDLKVSQRLQGTENAKLATGGIEIVASELRVLNKADVPPFPLDDPSVNEDLRLHYRYLDLRTAHMQRNIKLRHRVVKATRAAGYQAAFTALPGVARLTWSLSATRTFAPRAKCHKD